MQISSWIHPVHLSNTTECKNASLEHSSMQEHYRIFVHVHIYGRKTDNGNKCQPIPTHIVKVNRIGIFYTRTSENFPDPGNLDGKCTRPPFSIETLYFQTLHIHVHYGYRNDGALFAKLYQLYKFAHLFLLYNLL